MSNPPIDLLIYVNMNQETYNTCMKLLNQRSKQLEYQNKKYRESHPNAKPYNKTPNIHFRPIAYVPK